MRATILFTDIKGSSELWRLNASGMKAALLKHARQVLRLARKHTGVVVKTMGDAFMLIFRGKNSSIDAIRFANDLQRELQDKPIVVHEGHVIALRIGIAYGDLVKIDVEVQGKKLNDYFGNVVNAASRMESKMSPVHGFAYTNLVQNDLSLIEREMSAIRDELVDFSLLRVDFDNCRRRPKRSGRLLTSCMDMSHLKGVHVARALVAAPK